MEDNRSDEVSLQDSKGQVNATVVIWLDRVLSWKRAQYGKGKEEAVSVLI